jgi:glucosyl-dolichyl phosphate glucuronosyltransferase
MNPKYSVLVCTHNRAHILPRALDALGKLEVPTCIPWELIIVDNASNDGTDTAIADFSARSNAPLRYIREERLGHALAMNRGISECRGSIIVHTDDDAMPHPDWLVRLDDAFATHDAGIVFGPVEPVWEHGPPKWFSARFNGSFALLDYGGVPFFVTDADHPFFGVNHACLRSIYAKLGGYREDLGPMGRQSQMGSDTEFFLRVLGHGLRILYEPSAVVGHFIPSSRSAKSDLRRKIWQNRASQYRDLHEKFAENPWMFGLPRWYFPAALTSVRRYAKSIWRRDPSETFFHELRLRRFMVQLFQASLHGFGIKSPAGRSRAAVSIPGSEDGPEIRASNIAIPEGLGARTVGLR